MSEEPNACGALIIERGTLDALKAVPDKPAVVWITFPSASVDKLHAAVPAKLLGVP